MFKVRSRTASPWSVPVGGRFFDSAARRAVPFRSVLVRVAMAPQRVLRREGLGLRFMGSRGVSINKVIRVIRAISNPNKY